ncbi:beta-L-arabinofuranosidase domain-containing protein [Amycolatopsis sp. H20-H5]|uniref:beta-L-arabinofuranosidase domain-containing protein n=1 Tax=Amycolatopsis sp. H20-H5 TaxID=3046309 RepID=UPI002DB67AAB|nr:beta-L-arabinofuranosidase domain-containing protein [Amycolatopsis sp. H20-H5]MEC3978686.1 beta-L-arabinofuranosidase domain-containing protein [Amycolatopsis sp. H20-H5]
MSFARRSFLKATVAATGGIALGAASTSAASVAAPLYPGNRAPLRPAAFLRLPPGAVRAQGWLATQLGKQLDGLNGRYQEISHYLKFDNTGWVHPDLYGWEEVPYWLRGYGDLGYVTGDARVLADTRRWIDAILATQAPDGYFGPNAHRSSLNGHADLWPHMPMLHVVRSYAEYTGDGRVATFLSRFFRFLAAQPKGVFSEGWGATRWGDTIDVVFWLYNQTGEGFLLDLVRTIHAGSANWLGSALPTGHNVNLTQGFREPGQYWVLTGDPAHQAAAYTNYDRIQGRYGQFAGGGFAGDENARPGYGDPRQGFETCGIVEYMMSHEILGRATGDPVWADRVEELAFNLLPAALDPAGRAAHYVTAANSIQLDRQVKTLSQFDNDFAMQAYQPGIDNYRCCPHNYGMGWPYYVEEMWQATPDGGLCAALFGASTVTANVGPGVRVTVTETTGYPFDDTITFAVNPASPVEFPLVIRIPGWCPDPRLTVNGQPVSSGAGPRYATVRRTWRGGDRVTLRLPMATRTRTWTGNHSSVSVDRGPLTFSLAIKEDWSQVAGSAQWPEYEVKPGSAWNYGLVPGAAMDVVASGGDVADPFTPANSPVRITASVQRLDAWQADEQNVIAELADGPVAATTPVERVQLIPMGAARLRLTSFPQTGGTREWKTGWVRVQNKNSGKVLGVDRMSTVDSAQVVQFGDTGTADHLWRTIDHGDGWLRVQNRHSGKVLGVDGMSTANSARVVQFDDSGSDDHLWRLLDDGDGWFRVQNKNSGKVLGVDLMSTADSAIAVQFDDNGTADHLWRFLD